MKGNKFIISILIAVVTVLSAAVFSASAESSYIRGDADGDGVVTINDVTVIQRVIVNIPVSSYSKKAADIDGNGLDITDATNIQRYLAEFDDPYKIGEVVRYDEYELPFVPN